MRLWIRQIFWLTQQNGQDMCRHSYLHVAPGTKTKAIYIQIGYLVTWGHVLLNSIREVTFLGEVIKLDFSGHNQSKVGHS